MELESGYRLKSIRIDNTTELTKLSRDLENTGIRIEPTTIYTPSQNGIAERLNRTLITRTRALLIATELLDEL
jgi:transposase InsO family protein